MRFPVVSLIIVVMTVADITTSWAKSCSDRRQVCFGYCEKSNKNLAGCKAVCESYMNTCMSTGCWESKIVAKQCGFSAN
jgi:predicted transcriptional regulator